MAFDWDEFRPLAWRSHSIRSFNGDKPFDRFIREQIANELALALREMRRAGSGRDRLSPARTVGQ
jgi:hypothetical protein